MTFLKAKAVGGFKKDRKAITLRKMRVEKHKRNRLCCLLHTHSDRTGAELFGQSGGVFDTTDGGIAIRGGKGFVEQHQTIRAVEHQVPGVNGSLRRGIGRERFGQIDIFFIAVSFAHGMLERKPRGKGTGGFVVV